MKVADAEIWDLIQTMTAAERRTFQLRTQSQSNRHTIYRKLFSALLKQKKFDEAALQKVQPKRLSQWKHELLNFLLELLAELTEEKEKDAEIQHKLRQADVLYRKGLYTGAWKRLQSARRMAEGYERWALLIEVLRRERRALYRFERSGRKWQMTDDLNHEMQRAADLLATLVRLDTVYQRMWSRYTREGLANNEATKKIWKEDLQEAKAVLKDCPPTYRSEIYGHIIASLFHNAMNDKVAYLEAKRQVVLTLKAYPKISGDRPEEHWLALSNYGYAACTAGDAVAARDALDQLDHFSKDFPEVEQRYREEHLLLIIRVQLVEDKPRLSDELRPRIENILQQDREISVTVKLGIACFSASLLIRAREFKLALRWTNLILQLEHENLRTDYYQVLTILEFILLFERGKWDLLEQRYKVLRTQLPDDDSLAQAILKLFKTLCGLDPSDQKEKRRELNQFAEEIEPHTHDHPWTYLFDFHRWALADA